MDRMLKKCRGMQIRLKVRMTKELQCKIKPASIKKSCRWRVDTQVWNERGRSCFTVKCELWVLEAEVLKCSIELMRTNTHGLNLTILQQYTRIFHYTHTTNEQVPSYAFTHIFSFDPASSNIRSFPFCHRD